MGCKRKILALALTAICTLGAATASSASATIDFHSEVEHTLLNGTSTGSHVFKLGSSELTCSTAALAGTMKSATRASIEIVLAPAYSSCKFKSGGEEFTAHVKRLSCSYTYSVSKESEEGHLFQGPSAIGCEKAEDSIQAKLTILGKERACFSLPAQVFGGTEDYTREGAGTKRDLKLRATLTEIEYTLEDVCGEGGFANATYSGEATLSGEKEGGGQVGIWVGEPEFRSEATHTVLTASSTGAQVFTAAGSKLSCAEASFKGTLESATKSAEEIVLQPTYSSCTVEEEGAKLTAHVDPEGCGLGLGVIEETEGGGLYHGPGRIACEKAEEAIHVTVTLFGKEYACFKIAPQVAAGLVDYELEGSGSSRQIQATSTMTGLDYTLESICGSETGKAGAYDGQLTLAGESAGSSPLGVWIGFKPEPAFTTGADATTLTGKGLGTQVFKASGFEVECTEFELQSSAGTVQEEISAEPKYGGCTAVIPGLSTLPASFLGNKCDYVLTPNLAESLHIGCSTSGATKIEITAKILGSFRKCLDIFAQTPTESSIDFSNKTNSETGRMDVELESTITGITYEATGSCAFLGEHDDAEYEGSITLTGDSEGKPVDVTAKL